MTVLRNAAYEDVPALKEIWRRSFGDGEGYISMFFDLRFEPEEAFVAELDGVPAAMLAALPLSLRTETLSMKAAYIYGVATLPEFRGRGLSTELLEYAHTILKERGYDIAVLVPAERSLFRFYKTRGYTGGIREGKLRMLFSRMPHGGGMPERIDAKEYLRARNTLFGREGFFEWDARAVEYAVRETEYYGGGAFKIHANDGFGAALASVSNGVLMIKEAAFSGGREGFLQALAALAADFDASIVEARLPESSRISSKSSEFAMYRFLSERAVMPEGAYLNLVLD